MLTRLSATDLVVDHQTPRGPVRALECPAFQVNGGSLAVMGPSGSGKSTLLGLLAGLAIPTKGVIRVAGCTVSSLRDRDRVRYRRRSVGMVYQADNLLPHLTVEENVGLQLAICRSERRHAPEPNVRAVLDRLAIGALATRLPDQLSGGQRQRVSVARAVIHSPSVLLADEPTGALDATSGQAVIELLVELQHDLGALLVVVTHDPVIAAQLDWSMQLQRPQDLLAGGASSYVGASDAR